MKNFFYRSNNEFQYSNYKREVAPILNYSNVEEISKNDIKNLFEINKENEFLSYRFELLKKWIVTNEKYTNKYLSRLDALINKLFLTNELNSYEQQYLSHVRAISFAKSRNLKNLIIDFPIEKNEKVYYKYSNVKFYEKSEQFITIEDNSECYITSERIVILKNLNVYSMYYNQIKNFLFSSKGILVEISMGKQYLIVSDDNYVLYTSLDRILRFMKIKI